MRVDARRVAGFLRDPGSCRVVLLFGEDSGLIRERANGLVRLVAGSLDDPFRVVDLDRDAAVRLEAEAASLSLTGGRRVVRVRDVTDGAVAAVKTVLAGHGEALVVLEGPGLPSRSKLRTALEAAPDGAAIGCYPEEGKALEATVRGALAEASVTIEDQALAWVTAQLGGDRALTRQELEKLALHAGAGGAVDLAAAMVCIGDVAGLSLDDALFAATEGDVAGLDRALELALAGGQVAPSALRAGLGHLQRLHRARLAVAGGVPPEEAMRTARPPVFWQRQPAFTRALRLWPVGALEAALDGLNEAERSCRRTGAPVETICRNALMVIARRAAAARRGSSSTTPA
jgi:DNA polymerase-3 subunit delta